MPKIECTYASMKNSANGFRDSADKISGINEQIEEIISGIPLSTRGYYLLRARLRQISLISINRTVNKCHTIAQSIDEISAMYELTDTMVSCEKRSGTNADGSIDWKARIQTAVLPQSIKDVLLRLMETMGPGAEFGTLLWFLTKLRYTKNDLIKYSENDQLNHFLNGLRGQNNYESGGIIALGENDKLLYDYLKNGSNLTAGKGKIKTKAMKDLEDKHNKRNEARGKRREDKYNSDNKEGDSKNVRDSHKFAEKDITYFGLETSESASLLHADGKHYGPDGGSEYSADILKAEMHAKAAIGAFKYTDENGKTHHGNGVYAEAGESFSLLEASSSRRFGSEDNNVHFKGEAKVGAISSESSLALALTNKGPQIYAGLESKAVLAEGTLSGGVNLGGASINASVTGKVGLEASLKGGIKDGHLVIECGLAVGVGFSFSIDIDFSGAFKSVSQVMEEKIKDMNNIIEKARELYNAGRLNELESMGFPVEWLKVTDNS